MMRHVARSRGLQIILILLVCAGVYWADLGKRGFADTEGHRVASAWEMMETGDYLVPRLFGQVYLRKPPGMQWAIAGTTAVFGTSEFGARAASAVSATLMCVIAAGFTWVWFGRAWGLTAGLATALMPWFWLSGGRAAEIEMLNNLGAQLAVLSLLHLFLWEGRGWGRLRRRDLGVIGLAVLGVVIAALAKGPSFLPCVGAAVIASCIGQRSLGPMLSRALLAIASASVVILGVIAWLIFRAVMREPQTLVGQSLDEFFWADPIETFVMIGRSLISALPVVLAFSFPWHRGSVKESTASAADVRALRMARGIVLASLVALGIYVVMGVSNHRYTLPAFSFAPVIAAYVVRGFYTHFSRRRRIWARISMMGSPWAVLAFMLFGAAAYVIEEGKSNRSGRPEGLDLGSVLGEGDTIYADGAIEARPEVLLYAKETAARRGDDVLVFWTPGFEDLPSAGTGRRLVLLRSDRHDDDTRSDESVYLAVRFAGAEQLGTWHVHAYTFDLYRLPSGQPAISTRR